MVIAAVRPTGKKSIFDAYHEKNAWSKLYYILLYINGFFKFENHAATPIKSLLCSRLPLNQGTANQQRRNLTVVCGRVNQTLAWIWYEQCILNSLVWPQEYHNNLQSSLAWVERCYIALPMEHPCRSKRRQ